MVWFDPERHYQDLAGKLSLPDAAVEAYDGSLFELRHRLEPYLGEPGDSPPRLVVYVPLHEEETHNALVELPSRAWSYGRAVTPASETRAWRPSPERP